jgi:integrase
MGSTRTPGDDRTHQLGAHALALGGLRMRRRELARPLSLQRTRFPRWRPPRLLKSRRKPGFGTGLPDVTHLRAYRRRCVEHLLHDGEDRPRVGEALALQWEDLDFHAREIRVERAITNAGDLGTPKSGHGRTVDMGTSVRDVLQHHQAKLAKAWLKKKPRRAADGTIAVKGAMPPWVFPSDVWTPMDHANVGKAFKRVLKAAGLPLHHSPHSLRHTFASLLLQQGEAIQYVQRMLGHASITLTVDIYGKWLPMGNKAAVDRLDEPPFSESGGKLVADATRTSKRRLQVVEGLGDPPRTRTLNPEIKSLLLYH